MNTKYEQDEQNEKWPTLSAEDLKLRDLRDKMFRARDILDYSTLSQRGEATARWVDASKAYDAELQRVASAH